jgi:thioredoxin 1
MERLGERDFEEARLRRPGEWAVAFLADWCPFCRAFRPEFEAFAPHWAGSSAVADVTDLDSPLWDRFDLEVIPTVVVFRDGTLVARADGRAGEGLETSDLRRLRARVEDRARPRDRGPPPGTKT